MTTLETLERLIDPDEQAHLQRHQRALLTRLLRSPGRLVSNGAIEEAIGSDSVARRQSLRVLRRNLRRRQLPVAVVIEWGRGAALVRVEGG